MFEILDGEPGQQAALKLKTKPGFNKGLMRYFAKEFKTAFVLFQGVLGANPDDKTARFDLKRSTQFLSQGIPEGWQGLETIQSE